MKPVILTFAAFYLPGYKAGGPIRTIANLVDALGDEFDFRIVTSDRDATDTKPYPNVATQAGWTSVGKATVLYLSPADRSLKKIARILNETPHDVLYLNSFFDPDFTLKPLIARRLGLAPRKPTVLAPRGEFSPNALELKAWKKKPFLLAAHVAGLYRDLTWQASSEHEKANIRRSRGNAAANIRIAPNLPAMIEGGEHCPRAEGEPLRICFLSRISPMKNLEFALRTLQQVRSPVLFDIYGPIGDEDYWSRCRALASELPKHIAVSYHGNVEHAGVPATLARYDLFFLPSKGENYGHVIFEALSAGTPVLISDKTPWCGLFESGIGRDLPLDSEVDFAKAIDTQAFEDADMSGVRRRKAKNFARARREDSTVLTENRRLFADLANAK